MVAMHNSTLPLPSCLWATLPQKEAQTICPNTMTLRIADIFNSQCSIYITGSLTHTGVAHYYSDVNFWFWFYSTAH